jgi:hypothetical protein
MFNWHHTQKPVSALGQKSLLSVVGDILSQQQSPMHE